MRAIIGIVMVFGCVFGGYWAAGGKFEVIIKALPVEFTIIFGGAVGAMVIGNSGRILKSVLKDVGKVFKGGKWTAQDYQDLLCLLFHIIKLIKQKGILAVESHIENPKESSLFNHFPRIANDHFALDFIADTFRNLSLNLDDPHQVFDAMEAQLEKHHHEDMGGQEALQTMADGLPAIGIVAAVLGVIKTMKSVTEPPEVLGGLIASALVGTFLGVFLAYTVVGPMANRVKQIKDEDHLFYLIIRDVIVAHLNGNAPQVAVEIGRGNVPTHYQPSFVELEEAMNNLEIPTD